MYLIWLYGKVRGILLIIVGEGESKELSLNREGGQVMNTTQEIKVSSASQEIDSWRRYIYFEREGKSYELILFWDQFNGYDTTWRSEDGVAISKAPEWAYNWDNNDWPSFEGLLDELTFEMEGVK